MDAHENHRTDFDQWLLEEYGFEADGTPTKKRPPSFITSDGCFSHEKYVNWKTEQYEIWKKERRKEVLQDLAAFDQELGI